MTALGLCTLLYFIVTFWSEESTARWRERTEQENLERAMANLRASSSRRGRGSR